MLTCIKCNGSFPQSEFGKRKNGTHYNYCRECANAYGRAYRAQKSSSITEQRAGFRTHNLNEKRKAAQAAMSGYAYEKTSYKEANKLNREKVDAQICVTCGLTKTISEYHSQKSNKSGFSYQCKSCANAIREERRLSDPDGQSAYWAAHYLANQEQKKAQTNAYYYANKEVCRERQAAWYAENKESHASSARAWREQNADYLREYNRLRRLENLEEIREARRQHYANNKHMYIANSNKRRAATVQATVLWADFDAIKDIYKQSEELTRSTGVPHCVDHIIPLNHKLVCGLHVETNLQILTAAENTAKSNFFVPGPMESLEQSKHPLKQASFSFAA